jgi:hypothetical protein
MNQPPSSTVSAMKTSVTTRPGVAACRKSPSQASRIAAIRASEAKGWLTLTGAWCPLARAVHASASPARPNGMANRPSGIFGAVIFASVRDVPRAVRRGRLK